MTLLNNRNESMLMFPSVIIDCSFAGECPVLRQIYAVVFRNEICLKINCKWKKEEREERLTMVNLGFIELI